VPPAVGRTQCRRPWGGFAGLWLAVTASLACGEEQVQATATAATQPARAAAAVVRATPWPQHVIHGGKIPEGFRPEPVTTTAIGPDGRPVSVSVAPTYVFTYAIGPPVAAGPSRSGATVAQRPVPARPASVPYGTNWVFQTEGVKPASSSLAPSPPLPAAGIAAWGGSPLGRPAPPLRPVPAAPPAVPPQAYAATPPLQTVPQPQPMPPMQPVPQVPLAMPPGGPLGPPPSQWGTPSGQVAAAVPAAAGTTQAIRSPPPTQGHRWRVVKVFDGDTLTCLDDTNLTQEVCLAEIDAPELGQDSGRACREALADLVFGRTVQVVDQGKDRSGRWVARVYADGIDVNRQLVATGHAWHFAAASSDASLAAVEAEARRQRLGLWSRPDPQPPWEWRQAQRSQPGTP